jgi:hypothetical protein
MGHRGSCEGLGRPRLAAIASLLATLALITATLSGSAAAAAPTPMDAGAGNPPKRDMRVADLADFVERERGLDFKHRVRVRFLTDEQFTKEFATDEGDLTAQDKKDLEETAGFLRAVGLSQVDADQLLEDFSTIDATGTLAFYDHEKREVVVRGKELDVATKVTVVHELTHALQDQRFDLDKLDAVAGNSGAFAEIALLEGDAIRMEDEYVATLGQQDQEAYDREFEQQIAESESAVPPDVPAVLEIIDFAPYALGPTFVEAIVIQEGEKGVDDAFRRQPTSDKQILDPSAYLDGDGPERVRAPKLGPGEKPVGKPDTFGALGLYLMLAARLDPAVALPTIGSWAGDSFVGFERGGSACVRATFKGTEPGGVDRIHAALGQWAAAGPSGAATVERVSETATLTSCDPDQEPDEQRGARIGRRARRPRVRAVG